MRYIIHAFACIIWLILFYGSLWTIIFGNVFIGVVLLLGGLLWPIIYLRIWDYAEEKQEWL